MLRFDLPTNVIPAEAGTQSGLALMAVCGQHSLIAFYPNRRTAPVETCLGSRLRGNDGGVWGAINHKLKSRTKTVGEMR